MSHAVTPAVSQNHFLETDSVPPRKLPAFNFAECGPPRSDP